MDGEEDESLSRLVAEHPYSDEEDGHNYRNGHAFNGGRLLSNRRHGGAPKRTSHRVPILTIALTTSVLANVLLVILLYKGGGTASTPSFDLASETPVSCDHKSASPAPLQRTNYNSSLTAALCPETDGNVPLCPTDHKNLQKLRAEAKKYKNIFEDLSVTEIQAVYDYLRKEQRLGIRPYDDESGNHIFSIELHVPNKSAALLFLQGRGPRPPREAQVVLEQPQAWATPVVQELVIGPLPHPTYHKPNPRRSSSNVPYRFHPTYGIHAAYRSLARQMNVAFNTIIRESYGASFVNCQHRCLVLLSQKTSSAYSDRTLIVLTAYYPSDFVTINPLDLMFVMKETGKDSNQFRLDSMEYGGQTFHSIDAFVRAYRRRATPRIRRTFPKPVPGETSNPGTMDMRGQKFPETFQEGSRQFEPEGKRYIVENQHIRYMKWSFNLRMSMASGPQVWDVRWAGERIAYEISLQDVAVIYAGANPTTFYAHLSDSAFGLGDKAYGLVPGVDCPDHATFLSVPVYNKTKNGPITHPNTFCVFEHNNGVPLRRHRSDDAANGRNYGGLVDRVLIVRTVLVEYNYDYIFDIVFHLNGAVEVTSHATGYVMSQHYSTAEKPFGFRIHEDAVGSIHHHLMNFKIDLDILGTENR
ncbi:amine oxidase [Elysia marginata]|uniref:Amine oxidase n=1 Tax=Elysia marginata TaxID=1093978 RepID=A0AAV4IRE8_9GAST|nr:amine oxidase [Elysia marginata]